MARNIEEILGRRINSVKELKDAMKEYRDSLIGVDETSEEYISTSEKLSAAQDELNKVTRAGKDYFDGQSDSIKGLEVQYKQMYNAYKQMSAAEREGAEGREMAQKLQETSNKLNDLKKEVGNFKDNIGRYSDGVTEAFGKMGISIGSLTKPFNNIMELIAKGSGKSVEELQKIGKGVDGIGKNLKGLNGPAALASGALKSVGAAMKALIANPVGATIMAIVVAFKALSAIANQVKDAINNNEESQNRLKKAMTAFQPIIDGVKNAFDQLGSAVVTVIEFVSKAVTKIEEGIAKLTDFLGITKGAADRIKETNEVYSELEERTQALTKAQREYKVEAAKETGEIERLREEASETDNLKKKKALLDEAKNRQAKLDEKNLEIAREELAIMQAKAELTANSAADNDALAEAEARVGQAEANAARNARQYNKQLNSLRTTMKGAGTDYKKMAAELNKKLVLDSKTEIERLTEQYTTEKALLEKYGYDTILLTKQYNKKVEEIKKTAHKTEVDRRKQELSDTRTFWEESRRILIERYGENSNIVADFNKAQMEKERRNLQDFIRSSTESIFDFGNLLNEGFNKADEKIKGGWKVTEEYLKNAKDFMSGWFQTISDNVEMFNEESANVQIKLFPEIDWSSIKSYDEYKNRVNDFIQFMSQFIENMQGQELELTRALITINNGVDEDMVRRQEILRQEKNFIEDFEMLKIKNSDEYNLKVAETTARRLQEEKTFYENLLDSQKTNYQQQMDALAQSAKEHKEALKRVEKTILMGIENDYNNAIYNATQANDPEEAVRLEQEKAERIKAIQDEFQQKMLESDKQFQVDSIALTEQYNSQKIETEGKLYDTLADMRDADLELEALAIERRQALWDNLTDSVASVSSSIQSLVGTYSTLMQAEIDSGKLTAVEAEKKKKKLKDLAKVQRDVAIAGIAASTAGALMDVWRGYSAELKINAETAAATGPAAAATKAALDAKSLASAILRTVGIGTNAIAQIAAAKGNYVTTVNSLQDSSSNASASVATPVEIDSNPYTYTRTLQTTEEEEKLNQPIYVTVTDIDEGLKNRAKVVDESRF